MPVVIKNMSARTNEVVNFDMGAPVVAHAAGISYWKFQYGGSNPFGLPGPDHHVMRLGLGVSSIKNGQQVQCTVAGALSDDSGAGIDHANSTVRLVCMAVTSAEDDQFHMTQVNGVQSGQSGGELALSPTARSVEQALLNGWDLAYSGEDHHMKNLALGVDFNANGSRASLTARARMADDSGHSDDGTASGALFTAGMSQVTLLSSLLPPTQSFGPINVNFGRKIKSAGVFIRGLSIAFSGDDHHIRTIGGGVSEFTWSESVLNLREANAFMTDSSGHSQSNATTSSYVNLVAFAVVKS